MAQTCCSFNHDKNKSFQTLCLVLGLSLAQEEAAEGVSPAIRRLRLRRPRPVGISNPDGIAEGRPIPLRRIPQGKVNILNT